MPAPIIVSSGTAATGTTFKAYWRALGRRLGPFSTRTATATASGFEAASLVLCEALADDDDAPDSFRRAFLYVLNGDQAGQQKRLRTEGTEPAAGALKLASPFSAPLASGSEVDLSRPLPVDAYGQWPTLKEVVLAALRRLPLHHDLDFAYATDQVRYGLDSLPWTLRRDQVLDVYPPIPSGYTAEQIVPRPASRGSWAVEYDGDAPYLLLLSGFNDAETFFVRVRRPSSSWIKSGGVWGDSSGPTAADDEALYDADTVANVGLAIACERLEAYWSDQGDDAQAARWAQKRDRLGLGAAAARFYQGFRTDGRQRVGAVGRTWA